MSSQVQGCFLDFWATDCAESFGLRFKEADRITLTVGKIVAFVFDVFIKNPVEMSVGNSIILFRNFSKLNLNQALTFLAASIFGSAYVVGLGFLCASMSNLLFFAYVVLCIRYTEHLFWCVLNDICPTRVSLYLNTLYRLDVDNKSQYIKFCRGLKGYQLLTYCKNVEGGYLDNFLEALTEDQCGELFKAIDAVDYATYAKFFSRVQGCWLEKICLGLSSEQILTFFKNLEGDDHRRFLNALNEDQYGALFEVIDAADDATYVKFFNRLKFFMPPQGDCLRKICSGLTPDKILTYFKKVECGDGFIYFLNFFEPNQLRDLLEGLRADDCNIKLIPPNLQPFDDLAIKNLLWRVKWASSQ